MDLARKPGRKAGRHAFAPPRLLCLEDRWVPATLLVDDDLVQFPHAKFKTIQAAVDASHPGDLILVAKGTYTEQVTIPAGKDGLTLLSASHVSTDHGDDDGDSDGNDHNSHGGSSQDAVIKAPATLDSSLAIVHIAGAQHVTVEGFTVTGPGSAPGALDVGISVTDGGSARILDNKVTAIRDNPLSGGENGLGILVGGKTSASAVVEGNFVADYQKSGIIVNGADSHAVVKDNTIVGAGSTSLVVQNGIQISDGADAVVANNQISGNVFTPEGTDAAGIYVVDNVGGKVLIAHNRLFGNEDGILVENSSKVTITKNNIIGSTLDGIVLNLGTSAVVVSDNKVTASGRDGINVADTTLSLIEKNHVTTSSRDGIHLSGGASGIVVTHNKLKHNARWDAFDDTTGGGTAGTADLWFDNHIGTKSPSGLR
jgi:parallel beta-helix repeat protein